LRIRPQQTYRIAAEDLRAERRSYPIALFETVFSNFERAQTLCSVAMLDGLLTFGRRQP
jgi:hypothetical protein